MFSIGDYASARAPTLGGDVNRDPSPLGGAGVDVDFANDLLVKFYIEVMRPNCSDNSRTTLRMGSPALSEG